MRWWVAASGVFRSPSWAEERQIGEREHAIPARAAQQNEEFENYFRLTADFGRNALTTPSFVSTYGPPMRSMQ